MSVDEDGRQEPLTDVKRALVFQGRAEPDDYNRTAQGLIDIVEDERLLSDREELWQHVSQKFGSGVYQVVTEQDVNGVWRYLGSERARVTSDKIEIIE